MLVGAPHASAQVCVPPPPGIVAWWPLDETAGRVANDIVGNHNGAYVDSVTVATPVAGKVAGGLRFGGPDDVTGPYVEVPDSEAWTLAKNDFTIELWANFDTNGTGTLGRPGDVFIGSDDGPFNVNKWFFAVGAGLLDFIMFDVADPPPNIFVARAQFSPVIGQWYHLAVTREAGLFTTFLDGQPVASEFSPSSIGNSSRPLTIGQAEGLGFMNGVLDEITFYNRALSTAELQSIFNADSAGKCKAGTTAFAAFNAEVEVKTLRAKSEAEGQFTLGDTSDGIDPSSEDVTFQIGSFSGLIPKGSFLFDPVTGAFTFRGAIGGVPIEAEIAPVGAVARTFTFEIEVRGVDAAAGANAVTVQLAIGNDNGTTSAPVESGAR